MIGNVGPNQRFRLADWCGLLPVMVIRTRTFGNLLIVFWMQLLKRLGFLPIETSTLLGCAPTNVELRRFSNVRVALFMKNTTRLPVQISALRAGSKSEEDRYKLANAAPKNLAFADV